MDSINVCYVVSCRDEESGQYIPLDTVFLDIEEAIEEAVTQQVEDSSSDPRVTQVILDPEHPRQRLARVIGDIQSAIAEASEEVAAGRKNMAFVEGLVLGEHLVTRHMDPPSLGGVEEGGKVVPPPRGKQRKGRV